VTNTSTSTTAPRSSIRLGRVSGIEIDLHWSVLVIMVLLTWSLADLTLPDLAKGYEPATYWIAAPFAVVVFFASLLAHELAHSVVARRRGVVVDRITLWLLGGVSQLHGEMATPEDELKIAAAGPLTSLALGAGFGTLALAVSVAGGPELAVATIGWLGALNLILAVFNLVPGAPLDGGRLLHARVWRRTGSRAEATAAASRAGARVGYALIGLGIALFMLGDLSALWFVLLGWFLLSAAQAEATNALLHGALANVKVRDVMTEYPTTVPEHISLETLVDEWFMAHACSAFPVVDVRGSVTGLITLAKVRTINRDRWRTLTVLDAADPRETVATGSPSEPIADLLPRMSAAKGGAGRALVLDAGQLVGIVSPSDVQRAIELASLRSPQDRVHAEREA
jgi:Zn-dependent protease